MSCYDADKLMQELATDEGCSRHAYQDSEGYWTIGVGRLIDERRGGGITREEAFYLLRNDIATAEADLDALEPRWRQLDSDRQLVLINMAFNLGQTRFAGFKRFWQAIGAFLDGQGAICLSVAADEMMASKWARQVGVRATRLADRMRVQA